MANLHWPDVFTAYSGNTFNLDAAGDAACGVLAADRELPIVGALVRLASAVAPPTYRISAEIVSSGAPNTGSASLLAANSFGIWTPTDGAANQVWYVPFTAPAAPSLGVEFAITARYESGTVGASNYARIYHGTSYATNGLYSFGTRTGGSWSLNAGLSGLAAVFSDGTLVGAGSPLITNAVPVAPDERQTVLTTSGGRLTGFFLDLTCYHGGAYVVELKTTSDVVLASASFGSDGQGARVGRRYCWLPAPVNVPAGTYRCALRTTNAATVKPQSLRLHALSGAAFTGNPFSGVISRRSASGGLLWQATGGRFWNGTAFSDQPDWVYSVLPILEEPAGAAGGRVRIRAA